MRRESAAPKTAEVVTEQYRPGSQLRVLLGDPGTGLHLLTDSSSGTAS